MDTRSVDTIEDNFSHPPQVAPHTHQPTPRIDLLIDIATIAGLALFALIARVILATQLDLVTDEVIYILGGKIYLPLLKHIPTSIGASGWTYNYEHPPFVKLLIGGTVAVNAALGHPVRELLAARIPSIIFGTLLIVAIYWLGKAPFGRVVALLAALCLTVSPWLVYFSALAYLDMTMTTLITMAYLLLWYAIRRPWLYLLSALLIVLGVDSKYTAVLVIPGMVLFIAYYFLAIRPRLPLERRPNIPWHWWLAAIILAPLMFLLLDPAIWPHPYDLLLHSFRFEWENAVHGHLTFIAGRYSEHIPHWAILYVVMTKISAFVTVPAAFFAIFTLVQHVRFLVHKNHLPTTEDISSAFLLIWLLSTLGMFSLLNIAVGTHYYLPTATPIALAGACGLAAMLHYRRDLRLIHDHDDRQTTPFIEQPLNTYSETYCLGPARVPVYSRGVPLWSPWSFPKNLLLKAPLVGVKPPIRTVIVLAVLTIALVGPHLLGLLTVHDAEGYSSEFFHSENTTLQVAYPAYRDALQWLAAHTTQHANIGLVGILNTVGKPGNRLSWYSYNQDLLTRFSVTEAHPDASNFPYDYLVWPMHLVQRGYTIPAPWRSHVVHAVMGGNTIYCYILARTSIADSSYERGMQGAMPLDWGTLSGRQGMGELAGSKFHVPQPLPPSPPPEAALHMKGNRALVT